MKTILTCKNTCVIAVGFPPACFDNLNTTSIARIRNGNAKQRRRCQGEAAVKAFCKPKIQKIQYDIIVNHFMNPLMQKTLAITNGSAPIKKSKGKSHLGRIILQSNGSTMRCFFKSFMTFDCMKYHIRLLSTLLYCY